MPFSFNHNSLKEFHVLQICSICGETFDSDYKLMKHKSKVHSQEFEKAGWVGGGEESCSCGGIHTPGAD